MRISGPLILLAFVCVAVQASSQTVVDEIVAKVNSEIILRSDLQKQIEIIRSDLMAQGVSGAELESAMLSAAPNILRDLIDESLLVQKSIEYGIDSEANLEVLRTMERIREQNDFETIEDLEEAIMAQGDSPESFRESIRKQYLSEQVLNYEVRSRITVTTEEMRAYYTEHLEEFDRPRGVNLAEIAKVVGNRPRAEVRADMEAILARLRDGEDFFQIASEESESTTAPNGGVLGYFEDGMLGAEFEAASGGLSRNQISDIFEVGDALVIIRLLERHNGGILSFELASSEIRAILSDEKSVPRVREYLTQLRRDGFVEVREGYVDSGAYEESDSGG